MNSSSLAVDSAIFEVKMALGVCSNKWASICSEIFSRFCLDIGGMSYHDWLSLYSLILEI